MFCLEINYLGLVSCTSPLLEGVREFEKLIQEPTNGESKMSKADVKSIRGTDEYTRTIHNFTTTRICASKRKKKK